MVVVVVTAVMVVVMMMMTKVLKIVPFAMQIAPRKKLIK